MRSFVLGIHDVTVSIPKNSPQPTMLRLFKGQSSTIHVHLKRHSMKDLPEPEEAIGQWCRDLFVAKDKLLDKRNAEDTSSDRVLQDIGRPLKSLVVVATWACLLIFVVLKFLEWSSLLWSWKGIALTASALRVVTILMHILIRFSESGHSTPAKVAPAKPNKEGGLIEQQ